MADKRQYLIDELNDKLSDLMCEDSISSSEMESILDEAQLMNTFELQHFCEKCYNISLPNVREFRND